MPLVALIFAFTLAGGSPASGAAEAPEVPVHGAPPDATLRLNEGRLSTGVDYMWGRGQLKFGARHLAFHISGTPVAAVDAPTLSATGEVYHLTRLSDFSGTYSVMNLAAMTDGGSAALPMRNEHGVLLVLHVAAATPQGGRPSGSVRIQLNE